MIHNRSSAHAGQKMGSRTFLLVIWLRFLHCPMLSTSIKSTPSMVVKVAVMFCVTGSWFFLVRNTSTKKLPRSLSTLFVSCQWLCLEISRGVESAAVCGWPLDCNVVFARMTSTSCIAYLSWSRRDAFLGLRNAESNEWWVRWCFAYLTRAPRPHHSEARHAISQRCKQARVNSCTVSRYLLHTVMCTCLGCLSR